MSGNTTRKTAWEAVYLVFLLIFVDFRVGIAHGLGLESAGQFGDGEPGRAALERLFQRVVHELVLVQRLDQTATRLPNLLQVAVHFVDAVLFAALQIGVDAEEDARPAASVAVVD